MLPSRDETDGKPSNYNYRAFQFIGSKSNLAYWSNNGLHCRSFFQKGRDRDVHGVKSLNPRDPSTGHPVE